MKKHEAAFSTLLILSAITLLVGVATNADASDAEYTFGRRIASRIRHEDITFCTPQWSLKDQPQWKNDLARDLQVHLCLAGMKNPDHIRNIIAMGLVESGYNLEAIGDSGCAWGAFQLHTCGHHGLSAKRFVEKNPEWKTWERQRDWFIDRTMTAYEQYNGDIFRTVLQHNSPAAAHDGIDTKAGYWRKVHRFTFQYVL